MPRNQLFYDSFYDEITEILENKYGKISENYRINYAAKKYFKYNVLCNKIKENENVKKIILDFINAHNDNEIKYSSELDGYTYVIDSKIIYDISLILASFYEKEYLRLIRLSKFNNLYSCKKASDFDTTIFENKELEYIVLLYREINGIYDEDEEDYIIISVKAFLYSWNKFTNEQKVECHKSAKIALKNLIPFFESIYKDIFTTEITLQFIDIILKSKSSIECKLLAKMNFSEFYDVYDELN